MTHSPPRPSPGARRPGRRHRKKRSSSAPVLAFTLSAVAVLLAGLVVFVVVSHARSHSASSTSSSDSSATPSTGGDNGNAGSGAVSGDKIFELGDHPILQNPDAGLANIPCQLPPWRSDESSTEAFFTAAEGCLNEVWGQFLQAYHLPFMPPALHFPDGPTFQTACGTIGVSVATAAYYCDNNLYVPYRGLQIDQYGNNPGVYLALIAHEYGHHVQEVAGIMDAVWQQIYQAGPTTPAGLDLSRRKELQAQCFSGMFLGAMVDRGGSVTRDEYEKAWRDQDTRGDNTSGSHDHGTNAHYAQWWRTGAQYNRIAKCNTFTAPASEVS